ncbi:hypothetical protein AcW1_003175 [Taiwanofungus camphoratus]|nr:hypothetical protein AcV5_001636 [Antrodia cinnamomea]KAI0922329.1 hypothetical protein AcV7_005887 [Antrodia cinnamomea]KAI0942584.1 hypothetical protein AcW1_003175 [Antrodia cinnamomea]
MPLPTFTPIFRPLLKNRTARYVCFVLCATTVLYTVFNTTYRIYSPATSISNLTVEISASPSLSHVAPTDISSTPLNDDILSKGLHNSMSGNPDVHPSPTPLVESQINNSTRRANATMLMLARNSELDKAAASVMELEEKFNKQFGYPWIFLNNVPFSNEFKERMSAIVSGPVTFALIPPHHWYQPDWIDEEKATEGRRKMTEDGIIYAGSVSYRNMCRFNSGFFYRHPLLQQYKWYWRVEPDVHFHCVIDEDPFLYMEQHDKVYGFTIALLEFEKTIMTLWRTVKEFTEQNPHYVSSDNSMGFLSEDGGETYNLCHFWSNFEIANMDFWRGDAYSDFFNYLDTKGGFYYERWGDAPVHSIAASLFLRKDQVHFFDEIGYEHHPFTHCPHGPGVHKKKQCTCRGWRSFDYMGYSCMRQWERIFK